MVAKSSLSLLLFLAACGNDNRLERTKSPPDVVIVSPADGDVVRQGQGAVAITGTVSDGYDDPVDIDVTLTVGGADGGPVTVNADGTLSASLDPDTLALGALSLTLTATDSDGDVDTDTIDITVGGPLGAPTVTIDTPEDGATYTLGDAVAFRGEATDLTTAGDDLAFTWNSSLDGDIPGAVSADGTSALFAGSLSEGTHVITLSAIDEDGEVGSDSITVVVEAEEIIPEPGDLVFSELMINPEVVEDEVGEWVELYNTSGSPIDVSGYTFRDEDADSWVLEGPILVAAHDYVVLCANTDTTVNGGVPCDGWFFRDSTGAGLALANGPDEVILTRPDGVDIDYLHYEDGWFVPGAAMQLDPVWLGDADNDTATHWCTATVIPAGMTEPGSPGAENEVCGEM